MSPEEMHDPHRWWYGVREEQFVAGLTALDEVLDTLSPLQRRDVLEMTLPGVVHVLACWDELRDVLDRLRRLDGHTAIDLLRDRGEFSGLSMDQADAEDRVRGELLGELRDVVKSYRWAPITGRQVALVAVAP